MTILDTNVLSALMHVAPDKNVVAWLDRQPRASIWITSITVLEIRFGLQIMPGGKRRSALIQSFQELLNRIDNRVVPFDVAAAQEAGDLMASRQKNGRPGDLRDTMIASIAIAQHATLATRNTAHFGDIDVSLVDPWTH
ncbi:MAG: type II toxin-antitoxin system VapC family toxin [Candidatus Sulfotelmatobacter sp.]